MPRIQVNDIEIYYEIQGIGPKLLFISGTGGDLRNKPNVFAGPLKDHFTVLAYDQRGLGRTGKPDRPYSMEDYAHDAAGLIEALEWGKCLVEGVSFGGMVAQEFALHHPDKTKRLALLCTSSGGEGGASYPLHELSDLPPEEWARKSLEISDLRMNREWQEQNQDSFNSLLEARISLLKSKPDDAELVMGSGRQLEARKLHDTFDRLPTLRIPIGIFGGKYDGIASPENLTNLHKQIPDSELMFFEGGHLFFAQDPEAYPRIISFLNS